MTIFISWLALVLSCIALGWHIYSYYHALKAKLKITIDKINSGDSNKKYSVVVTNIKYRKRYIKDIYFTVKAPKRWRLSSTRKGKEIPFFENLILPTEISLNSEEFIDKSIDGDGGSLTGTVCLSNEKFKELATDRKKLRIVVVDTHDKKHYSKWIDIKYDNFS